MNAPTPLDDAQHPAWGSLRMALVGPLPPPSGGMANQTEQLARLLREAGIAVDVVQVNAPYRPAFVGRLRGVRAVFRLLPYLWSLWRCAGRVRLVHVMANSGWAWHLFAAPAVWIARLRGVPAIVNYRGGHAGLFMQAQSGWILPTLARAAGVVVPSGFLQSVFQRWDVPTQVVPNIIDLSRFAPAAAAPMGVHVIVSRNLEDIYDIGTALRAYARIRARHPDARLTVAGSGPRLVDLQALARELGVADAVTFTGRLDNERMAGLYRSATLVLNPSTADNMPISLLESMASGTPIVSTDVGGIPYLVEHERTALLVSPGDDAAMAREALRLLDDPALAGRLRRAGIEAAAAYTWAQVRPRLFGVYARALQGSQPAASQRRLA